MTTELIENVTVTELVESDSGTVVAVEIPGVVELLEVGVQGPEGIPGTGTMDGVADDPSPALGGDLELGSYNIKGQLENTDLVIDGGLL